MGSRVATSIAMIRPRRGSEYEGKPLCPDFVERRGMQPAPAAEPGG